MKKLILLGLLVLSGQANATQITMTNPREEQTENGKRYASMRTAITHSPTSLKALVPMQKPLIQRIQKSEKGRRANHQLYLVWGYGVRLYAGSEVCRDDDTASPVTNKPQKSSTTGS